MNKLPFFLRCKNQSFKTTFFSAIDFGSLNITPICKGADERAKQIEKKIKEEEDYFLVGIPVFELPFSFLEEAYGVLSPVQTPF